MNNEDMSNLFSKFSAFMNSNENSSNSSISPEAIANMAKMLQNNNNNNNSENTNSNSSNTPNFDMETILKMKSIFEQMNKKDDPRSNLLLSLKPYLKESRRNKVDQYIQFFKMSTILDMFNKTSNTGGGSK